MNFTPKRIYDTGLTYYLMCSSRVAILGDTSYGECCVDEVAAEHVGADSVIHYGHTCMTPTQVGPLTLSVNLFLLCMLGGQSNAMKLS